MKISVLTGSPIYFSGPFQSGMIAQAVKKNLVSLEVIDLHDFAADKYRSIDDYPYGGGGGMVLKCEPVFNALESVFSGKESGKKRRVIYTSPQGELFNQKKARELSLDEELVFLCGRYKGIDERINLEWVTDEISVGDYILSGGEAAVLTIVDAVIRLIPEVLNNFDSAQSDSFEDELLDCGYYTRPAEFRGLKVPDVLLSGDHKKIEAFRLAEKLERTKKRRPDLYQKYMNENSSSEV